MKYRRIKSKGLESSQRGELEDNIVSVNSERSSASALWTEKKWINQRLKIPVKEETQQEGPPIISPGRQHMSHAISEPYCESNIKPKDVERGQFYPRDRRQGTLALSIIVI